MILGCVCNIKSSDATINGSGDIHYSGSPAKINTSVRGSGNIRQ